MTKLTRTLYSWSTAAGTRAIQESWWHLQCAIRACTIHSARGWREEKAANLQRTNTRCSSSSHWLTVKLRTKLISMTAAGNFIPQKTEKKCNELGGPSSQVDTVPLCAWLTVKTFACMSVGSAEERAGDWAHLHNIANIFYRVHV